MRESPRSRRQSNEIIAGFIASPSIDKFAAFVTRDYAHILASLVGSRYRSIAGAKDISAAKTTERLYSLYLPPEQSVADACRDRNGAR
jgi:hypothetical protein